MISVEAYRADPCGTLSIPRWKSKAFPVPANMRIVHDRDYRPDPQYADEPYFRLLHRLTDIAPEDAAFCCKTAEAADVPLMAELINRCYDDLSVTSEQLMQYRRTAVFRSDLWIIVYDAQTKACAGCGIADIDPEAGEGILEWIQVLPEHRGRGAGQFIVNELLRRMSGRAEFATVSGRIHNATHPERLYRRCGFAGNDVWHVLTQR